MTRALRSPLMRPQGISPGFDSKHIAAGKIRLSAFASGAALYDIVHGGASSVPGSGSRSAIQTQFGPAVNFGTSGNNFTAFDEPAIETWTQGTFAGVFINNNITATGQLFRTSTAGGTFGLGITTGVVTVVGPGFFFNVPNTIPVMSVGVPYFCALSVTSGLQNCVVVDLLSGQTWKGFLGGTLSPVTGTNSVYGVGVALGVQIMNVMAGMNFLPLDELVEWARDPWSFWFPSAGNNALLLPQKVAHVIDVVALVGANVVATAGAVVATGSVTVAITGAAATTAAGTVSAFSSSLFTTVRAKQFSPSLRSPFVRPQAAPYGLNQAHPATHNARLAAIANADGTMFDLVSNKIGFWAFAGGENADLGPAAFPSTSANGGIAWPAVVAGEVLLGFTMAAVFQTRGSTHGQTLVETSQTGGAGLSVTSSGVVSFGEAGVTGPTFGVAIPGHNYFLVVSQYGTTGKPRARGVLMDMATGQFFVADSGPNNYGGTTVGTNYSTIGAGTGFVDPGRVYAAMISATSISVAQQLEWAKDPWSFWFRNERVNLIQTAGISRSSQLISGAFVTAVAGTVRVPKNVAITGATATTAAGTVAESSAHALTAAAATTAAGTVTVSASLPVNIAISGSSATTAAGTVTVSSGPALTGASATSSAGSVGSIGRLRLGGSSATSAAGVIACLVDGLVTGDTSTVAAGAVAESSALALTGAAATTAAGTLSPSSTVSPTGAASSSASGQPATRVRSIIAGAAGTSSAGSIKASLSAGIFGASVSTAAGPVTEISLENVNLAGASVSTAPGHASASAVAAVAGASVSTAAGTPSKSTAWPAPGVKATTAAGTTQESSAVGVAGASVSTAVGSMSTAIIPPVIVTISGASVATFVGQVVVSDQTYISGINEGRSLGLDWQSANATLTLGVSR